jgi:glutamine cyclotransferase
MNKWIAVAASVFLGVILSIAAFFIFQSLTSCSNAPVSYFYSVVATFPHDKTAFTEGLLYSDGYLYESTGGWGSSSLRQVSLSSGSVIREVSLPSTYFGEGLTLVNGSLVQLTWQSGIGFVYDLDTFDLKSNFSYSTEGWGLAFDGSKLIMSDGTSNLYFLDPNTFQTIGSVAVRNGSVPVTNLNELEFVNGALYANVWHDQKILIINLQSGQIRGYIDLTGIYQPTDSESVLNGIAFDQVSGDLFITGKNWPYLYQIKIT